MIIIFPYCHDMITRWSDSHDRPLGSRCAARCGWRHPIQPKPFVQQRLVGGGSSKWEVLKSLSLMSKGWGKLLGTLWSRGRVLKSRWVKDRIRERQSDPFIQLAVGWDGERSPRKTLIKTWNSSLDGWKPKAVTWSWKNKPKTVPIDWLIDWRLDEGQN